MAAENLVVAKAVPAVLKAVALFAPPAWTRLEPQSVTGDPTPGLTAALHDPLWLLGRQWQLGEFRGEDAGMPVAVRIASEMQRVTAWQPGDPAASKPPRPLPADEPLDPWVEREPPGAAGPGLLQRAEAGATLVAMLKDAGLDARAALVKKHPLPTTAAAPPNAPPELFQVPPRYAILARAVPDAEAAAKALEAGTPDWLAAASADQKGAAQAWLAWYRGAVSPLPQNAAESWLPERLEYRFSVRAGDAAGQRVFRAPLHEGGAVDWFSFDHDPTGRLLLPGEPAPAPTAPPPVGAGTATSRRTQVVLASPLRFGGMPSDRLWEFEDGAVNLGRLETQAHDLARLCFVEFAMIYSADWFVVPLDVDVGSFTRVGELSYTTTFGDTYQVPLANDQGRAGRFRMFGVSVRGGDDVHPGLLVPPAARGVQEGDALEEVLLLRDEMANMAWAVEKRVQTVTGEPRTRDDELKPVNAPEQFVGGADLQYLLQTAVPKHWIPLVPIPTTGKGGFVLRKGTMSDVDDSVGVLLDPTPFTLQEEEVPREGVRVRRVPSLARTRTGAYVRWVARRVSVGRGEGASQLQDDATVR
jgi:hypothetical protein